MSRGEEPVELCVIMPYSEFRSIDQRAKKVDSAPPVTSEESENKINEENTSDEVEMADSAPSEDPPKPPQPLPEKLKKQELKNTYRSTQIKKLLKLIESKTDSKDITGLENLDSLIKSALGSSKKMLSNEKMFFNYLFENNLSHFVKNRNKINLYYKFKDNWWTV